MACGYSRIVEVARYEGPPLSHPQEDLPALHPGEEQPEHQERGGALQQRLEARAEALECAGAEVGDEGALDEALPEMGNQIRGD